MKKDFGIWALRFLLWRQEEACKADWAPSNATNKQLQAADEAYGYAQEQEEVQELASFLQRTGRRWEMPGSSSPVSACLEPGTVVRITRTLRVFIGQQELRTRPMAKCILLLFLRHPEGIVLKEIYQYRAELTALYRRLTTSLDPLLIDERISRILDIFNNELNVNISRVNAALAALVPSDDFFGYGIRGKAGKAKRIPLDRSHIIWD